MTSTEPASFESVLAAVAQVEGWMTPAQARMLWDAACTLRGGARIVEIGSFRGRSLIVMARATVPGVEIIAIDPHAGNDRGPQEIEGFADEAAEDNAVFWANLRAAGVDERIRHLRTFSDQALDKIDGPIDMLYVDGAHRYTPALADIRHFGAKVPEGGVMLIHDSFSAVGVTLALIRQLFFGTDFRYEGRAGSMTRYRRATLRGRARAANALRQAGQLPWFVRNLIIKTLIVARMGQLTRIFRHDPSVWPH